MPKDIFLRVSVGHHHGDVVNLGERNRHIILGHPRRRGRLGGGRLLRVLDGKPGSRCLVESRHRPDPSSSREPASTVLCEHWVLAHGDPLDGLLPRGGGLAAAPPQETRAAAGPSPATRTDDQRHVGHSHDHLVALARVVGSAVGDRQPRASLSSPITRELLRSRIVPACLTPPGPVGPPPQMPPSGSRLVERGGWRCAPHVLRGRWVARHRRRHRGNDVVDPPGPKENISVDLWWL